MEYYSVIKKKEIMPSAAIWMDLEIIILSDICLTEKDKYHLTSLICGIFTKGDINKLIYKTETDLKNELMITMGAG